MYFSKLSTPLPQTPDSLIGCPRQCFIKYGPRWLILEWPQVRQFIKMQITWFPMQADGRNLVGGRERSEYLQFLLSLEVNFYVHLDLQNIHPGHCFSKCDTRLAASVSPRNVSEIKILRPHPRPAESHSGEGRGAGGLCLPRDSEVE